ncbi:MAG: aminoacetone oxidase family FAD-binding enzyme [Pleomorphochaeta sp.]
MNEYNTIIIGGGASGLFLAKNLAENNIETLVIEKMESPGKKLLITGGGMCNLTRDEKQHEFLTHYGNANKFLGAAFAQFSPKDTINWFENRGLKLAIREDKKIFPKVKSAKAVLETLFDKRYTLINNYKINEIKKEENYFIIDNSYKSKNLVIATGGMSYPSTGSTGDGYHYAKLFNHSINEIRPSLASFKITSEDVSKIEGISLQNITISLMDFHSKKNKIIKNTDDLIFTRIGISGPVVLDISKYATTDQAIYLNFNKEVIKENNNKLLSTSIKQQTKLPMRFINYLLLSLSIEDDISSNISKKKINIINEKLKRWEFKISLKGQLKGAMSTAGGIALKEVNRKTFESKLCPNLYFCGEVLDYSGDCGGFNLQACWSNAYCVYKNILDNLD